MRTTRKQRQGVPECRTSRHRSGLWIEFLEANANACQLLHSPRAAGGSETVTSTPNRAYSVIICQDKPSFSTPGFHVSILLHPRAAAMKQPLHMAVLGNFAQQLELESLLLHLPCHYFTCLCEKLKMRPVTMLPGVSPALRRHVAATAPHFSLKPLFSALQS